MLAYHSDPALKERILAQLAQHREADEIIKGQYWEGGKGCAVGCTIYSKDHAEYELPLGIPEELAHLEDEIFEGLPNAEAKLWPERFISAIRPGADLSRVHWQFLHWLLTVELALVTKAHPDVRPVVLRCAAVMEAPMRGQPIDEEEAARAAQAAWVAARAARAAAEASMAVAQAAADAAWAAEARAASYQRQADQLIALLEAA